MRKSKKRYYAFRRKQKIYLRAVGLDEGALNKVKLILSGAAYTVYDRKQGDFTVSLVFDDSLDIAIAINFFNYIKATDLDFCVWVSLVTERDVDGVSVPENVLDFISQTKAKIEFSVVFT